MSRGKVDNSIDEPFNDFESSETEIGKTSQESPEVAATSENKSKVKKLFSDFSLFDAMLLVSLILVTAATVRLFFAITQYGGYLWQSPWDVTL